MVRTALLTLPTPPSQGGESRRRLAFFPPLRTDLWPQLFSDVNCIALWISSEKILTRLYSVLHWFHRRLEVNVENPREKRCFQRMIVVSPGSVDNSKRCTVLWKIAARLITVSTSVNNEMWVKLSLAKGGYRGGLRVPLRCTRFGIQAIENRSKPSRDDSPLFDPYCLFCRNNP